MSHEYTAPSGQSNASSSALRFELDQGDDFLDRLRVKDPEAWRALATHHQPYLRKAIRQSLSRMRLPMDQVADVEQKTWLIAYNKIVHFERRQSGGSLFNWMCVIQYNVVKNLSRQRHHVSLDDDPELPDDSGPLAVRMSGEAAHNVETEIIDRETRREIHSALDLALERLSQRDREIVQRRVLWDEPVEALVEAYGLKAYRIYQIVSDAKRKMRDYLLAPDLFLRASSDKAAGKEQKPWRK